MGRAFTLFFLVLLALVVVLPYLAFVQHVQHPYDRLTDAHQSLTLRLAAPELLTVIEDARTVLSRSQSRDGSSGWDSQLSSFGPRKREENRPEFAPVDERMTRKTDPKTPVISSPRSFTTQDPRDLPSHSGPKSGDLVVGLGTGITPENLAVFAGSLREVNPFVTIVLYLDSPLPELHKAIVARFNISAIEFSVSLLQPTFLQHYHPSNYRWPLLYRYMEKNANNYRKVLMADVRDTYFQEDPFAAFNTGFFAFTGVESRKIGECGWNGGWVKDCFGHRMLNRISKKTIICSGVSMGTTAEVLAYLKTMSQTMETEPFSKCERNGVDQGVHNVLVHTGQIEGLQIQDQGSGWVANMQSGRARISKNVVINQNGRRVAVVHQYDRFKELQASYFKKFIFWELPSEQETCKLFTVVKNKELFKKRCDFKVTSGHSTGHCCESCLRVKGCKAFSFFGSQCFLKSCSESVSSTPLKGVTSGFLTSG